jgi:type IV fimbrial biogenesis protein FimT
MGRAAQRGVTLLELLVTMTILGVVLSLALPSFSSFLANTRLRGTADNIQAGLQVARMEALKRNESAAFLLLSSNNWVVNHFNPTGDSSSTIATRRSVSGNATACAGTTAVPAYQIQRSCGENNGATVAPNFSPGNVVTFDSQGRASAGATLPQIDISASGTSSQLRILISAGGQMRLCDPNNGATGDPRNCNN